MSTETTDRTYTDDMFSGEQIAEAIAAQSPYDKYTDVATLRQGEYKPETLEAFAKLARTLGGNITTSYGNMAVQRERPIEERRLTALYALRAKAERGEIEPAYLYGRPED